MNNNEFIGQMNHVNYGSDSMTKPINNVDLTLRLGASDFISEVNVSNTTIPLATTNPRVYYVGPIRTSTRINTVASPYYRPNFNLNLINDRPGNGGLMRGGSTEPIVPHVVNKASHGGPSAGHYYPVTNPAGRGGGLANFSPRAFTPSPSVIGLQQNKGIGSHGELSDSRNYPVTNPAGHGGGLSNFSASSFTTSQSVKGKQPLNGMGPHGGSSSSHYYPVTYLESHGSDLSNSSANSFTSSPSVNGKRPINGMRSHGGSTSSHYDPVTNPEGRSGGFSIISANSVSASPSAIRNQPNNGIGSHGGPSGSLSHPLTNSIGFGGNLINFSANSFTPSQSSINGNHQNNEFGTHEGPSASHHKPKITNPAGCGDVLINFTPNCFTPSLSFTSIQQKNRNPYTRFPSPVMQPTATPVNDNDGFQPVGNSTTVQYTEEVRTGAIDATRGGNNNATLEGHMYSVPAPNTAVKRCTGHGCKNVETPMWRRGPLGPKTLCNACGIRYRKDEEKKRGITPTPSKGPRANDS